MTTHDTRTAILRSVCESPWDDTPRLVYADWCEENGEPERAEFVRVQVELARFVPKPPCTALDHKTCTNAACVKWRLETDDLRRRERELLESLWGDMVAPIPFMGGSISGRDEITFARGFIHSIRLSWTDFLAVESKLLAGGTVECHACGGSGTSLRMDGNHGVSSVTPCERRGCVNGRVPRPFAATMQPIETVTLTTLPDNRQYCSEGIPAQSWLRVDGHRFDRVKCPACAGVRREMPRAGGQMMPRECDQCEGIPLNEWTCGDWAGVKFVIPEAR